MSDRLQATGIEFSVLKRYFRGLIHQNLSTCFFSALFAVEKGWDTDQLDPIFFLIQLQLIEV